MRPEDIDDLFKGKLEDHSSSLPSPLWDRLEERMQQQAKPEHSVDALFKSKLQNHGTPLPAGLWSRIEDRMKAGQTKVRPLWTWYAAACIALLLSVVGIWKLQQNPTDNSLAGIESVKNSSQLRANKTPEPVKNNSEPGAKSIVTNEIPVLADANRLEKTTGPETGKSGKQTRISASSADVVKLKPARPENRSSREEKTSVKMPEPKPEEQLLALNKAAEPKKPGISQEQEVVKSSSERNQQAEVAQPKPLQVEIILASDTRAEETADHEEEVSGNSKALFAKKVAKQLWNLKKGEKPDLQDLGIASSYTLEVKRKTQTLSKTINL